MMIRLVLAAMMFPAVTAAPTCTSASCCTPKVTGMCGYNTHDESGDLWSTAAGNTYSSTDTVCGTNSDLIAAAATTTKPASTATGAAAAAAICCMCPDGYAVDATFDGCTQCATGKFIAASTNRATAGTCTDVSKCSTYTCAAGSTAKAAAATTACTSYHAGTGACTAEQNEATCCDVLQCQLPDTMTGYATTGGATTTAKGAATGLACDTNYVGTATGTCATDDGDWSFAGCTIKALCSTHTCAAGSTAIAAAATTYCAGAACAATDAGTCCDDLQCQLPDTMTGYATTGGATTTVKGAATGLACDTNYVGTATGTCATDDGDWSFAGCTIKAFCSTHTCAAGSTAIAAAATTYCAGAACAATDTACCTVNQCKLPASTTGYVTTGSAATTTTKGALTVACADGYVASTAGAAGACAADDGEWALSGCTAKVVTEYCTDAADTDDDGSALDTFTCADESFAVPDVEVTCAKQSASTGTCTRTATEPTPYQVLGMWMADSPVALGTAMVDSSGTFCTATAGTAATCTETATTSVAADKALCEAVTALDDATACGLVDTSVGTDTGCTYTPTAVTCEVTVSETTCPVPAVEAKTTSSARSAAPVALVMMIAAALA